jgi:hypothetical protein
MWNRDVIAPLPEAGWFGHQEARRCAGLSAGYSICHVKKANRTIANTAEARPAMLLLLKPTMAIQRPTPNHAQNRVAK